MSIGQGADSTNQRRHAYVQERTTVGFFTDATLCIGCKACEVACKEWNHVPADGYDWKGHSYDNTAHLGASTWRHVAFLELNRPLVPHVAGPMDGRQEPPFSWVFLSDVCKHCEVAGCLEHCPTGAIVRTETGTVFVQDDVCNGCGYCVVGCPFGVIDKRSDEAPGGGGAYKCTFCYDRQRDGLTPACAKACPTESIRFGPLEQMRQEAAERARVLRDRGYRDVRIYDPKETTVGGTHAVFLHLGEPELWGLPAEPQVPTSLVPAAWRAAFFTGAVAMAGALLAFAIGGGAP
jgi:formate dehydrogenase iron-sulfur subunit